MQQSESHPPRIDDEAWETEQAVELVRRYHEYDRLTARVEALTAALRAFVDAEGACERFDHHGYCQTHWNLNDDGTCRVASVRAMLAEGDRIVTTEQAYDIVDNCPVDVEVREGYSRSRD